MDILKKNNEIIIIENFRKQFPEFPKGKLIKSESPDFILKTSPNYYIGIELTALPSPSYIINNLNISSFLTDLQHTIIKKEEKLKSYRKINADEYWLIIYTDDIEAPGIDIDNQLSKLPLPGGFDRIFLFGLFEGQIWPLKNEK
jgi:hypothetical protein